MKRIESAKDVAPGVASGHWTIENRVSVVKVQCRCVCGLSRPVFIQSLISGESSSCGCRSHDTIRAKHEAVAAASIQKLIDEHHSSGILTVKGRGGDNRHLLVQCACGKDLQVRKSKFLKGRVRSCGCKRYENQGKTNIASGKFQFHPGKQYGEWTIKECVVPKRWYICAHSCGAEARLSNAVVRYLANDGQLDCACTVPLPEAVDKGLAIEVNAARREQKKRIQRSSKIDLSQGTTIGFWTVLENIGNRLIKCRCVCGKEVDVERFSLQAGSKSCGCKKNELIRQTRLENGTIKASYGEVFGAWTVHDISDKQQYRLCVCKCGTVTEVSSGSLTAGTSLSCGCESKRNYGKTKKRLSVTKPAHLSIQEAGFVDWIRTIFPSVERQKSFPKANGGFHTADCFIPELNLAIEYNGLYWHCEEQIRQRLSHRTKAADDETPSQFENRINRDVRHFHLDRQNDARAAGINLIYIWEHEWKDSPEQVKNFLLSKFRQGTSMGARKLTFREVEPHEATAFCAQNHIQGSPGQVKYAAGGYYNGELAVLGTFGAHHRNGSTMVLNRFCGKSGFNVAGGLSKISKMAHEKFKATIITWTHRTISEGAAYEKAGWKKEAVLEPDYFYNKGTDAGEHYSKSSLRKTAEERLTGKTERQLREEQGFKRIWDCGKIRLVYGT